MADAAAGTSIGAEPEMDVSGHNITAPGARPIRRSRLIELAVPVLSFIVGLVVARHTIAHRYLVGDDVPYHLLRVRFGLTEVFGRGRLDAWSPIFGAGSQHFLVYGPGVTIGAGLIRLVTFGLLPVESALSVLCWITYAATGPATWYLARSIGFRRVPSGLAAMMSLAVSVPFGVGLAGTFDIGLLANGVATPLTLVALGLLIRCTTAQAVPDGDAGAVCARARPVVLGLVVAALVITHPPSAVVFAILGGIGVVLVLGSAIWQRWRLASGVPRSHPRLGLVLERFTVATVVMLLASAFWWVPLAADHSPMQASPVWATPELAARLLAMLRGEFAFGAAIAVAVAVGQLAIHLTLTLRRPDAGQRDLGRGLDLWPWAAVVATFGVAHLLPDVSVAALMPNRAAGYVAILFVVTAAAGLAELGRIASMAVPVRIRETVAVAGGAIAIVGVAAALVTVPEFIPARQRARSVDHLPAVHVIADALRATSTPEMRVAVAADRGLDAATGRMNTPFWIAYLADRPVLSDFGSNAVTPFYNYISLRLFLDGDTVTGRVPNDLARQEHWARVEPIITGAGVRRIVVGSQHRAEMDSTANWRLAWSDGIAFVYAWSPPAGHPPANAMVTTAGRADIRAVDVDPVDGRMAWDVDVDHDTDVTVALAHTGGWRADLDGRRVPIDGIDGLTVVRVPAGHGRLTLTRPTDPWALVGIVTTLTALVAAVAVGSRRAVRRRRLTPR